MTLAVEDRHIHEVRSGWQAPPAAQVVDLTSFAVMPGLVDAHDHFGIDMGDGETAAMQDPQWRTLKGVKNARAMLASGITTLRNAGEMHNLGLHIRRAIEAGWIEGPRTVLSGVPISSTGGHGWFLGLEADGADEVRKAVRTNLKAGTEMIKMIVTGGATTPGADLNHPCFGELEIRAAVEETHLAGKRIGVHCYGGPAATWAIEAGVDSIEHGTYLTDEQLDLMARLGTFLVVTSSVMRAAAESTSVAAFMRERFRRVSEDYVVLIRRARTHKVRVAVGCDTHHASIAEEVETLIAAGFTAVEALTVATRGGAEQCGMDRQVGSLVPGKLADFIAVEGDLEADPTLALRQVRHVFKNGQPQFAG
jgi:imidazolonepropionase-like amidohydrolase